jgi:osmotically-inducible protein OsmY
MKNTAFILAALSTVGTLSAGPGYQDQNLNQNSNQNQNTYYFQQDQQGSNFKQTSRTVVDDEIAHHVHKILSGNWMTHGYPDVTFDVNNGTVNLRGVVNTREEKMKVEQEVKKIDGVIKINSDISVGLKPAQANKPLAMNTSSTSTLNSSSTTATPATAASSRDTAATDKDRLINTKIREKLNKLAPKGYETIVLSTSNGIVIISGNLEKVEDIQKVSHEVKHVDGVKSVTNQISIRKPSY